MSTELGNAWAYISKKLGSKARAFLELIINSVVDAKNAVLLTSVDQSIAAIRGIWNPVLDSSNSRFLDATDFVSSAGLNQAIPDGASDVFTLTADLGVEWNEAIVGLWVSYCPLTDYYSPFSNLNTHYRSADLSLNVYFYVNTNYLESLRQSSTYLSVVTERPYPPLSDAPDINSIGKDYTFMTTNYGCIFGYKNTINTFFGDETSQYMVLQAINLSGTSLVLTFRKYAATVSKQVGGSAKASLVQVYKIS